jgi:hypothetical protein
VPPGGSTPGKPGQQGKPASLKDQIKKKPAVVVGIGGAAVVVIYALMKRSGSSSTPADAGGTDGGAMSNVTPTYDSSGTDSYNSLEDQLGTLQSQLADLTSTGQGDVAPPATTTTPTVKAPAAGFYRDISTKNIYEVANGKRYSVTPSTWAALQKSGTKAPKQVDNTWSGFATKLQGTKV